MIIHVYSIMRNEEDLLPYFLRHYSTFADTIFIIDDNSTDKTVKIAKTNRKVKLLKYKFTEGFVEEEHNTCFKKFYKKYSRGVADWVIIVDGDEFIYNKNLVAILEGQKKWGTKVIKTAGYNIYSEKFPTTKGQIYEECHMGLRTHLFDKAVIFNPSINVNFSGGRHETFLPKGVNRVRARILLLHFRYLSIFFSIKRLLNSTARFSDKQLFTHLRVALNRYEYGIAGIKSGKLTKVV